MKSVVPCANGFFLISALRDESAYLELLFLRQPIIAFVVVTGDGHTYADPVVPFDNDFCTSSDLLCSAIEHDDVTTSDLYGEMSVEEWKCAIRANFGKNKNEKS